MCCLAATLVLLGPRAAILVWWLLNQARWEAAFDSFLVPFIGFLVLPWTTLMYVAVAPRGDLVGFDWVWMGLAVLADVASWASGPYSRRTRYATAA